MSDGVESHPTSFGFNDLNLKSRHHGKKGDL
jgi:hypothetical protein